MLEREGLQLLWMDRLPCHHTPQGSRLTPAPTPALLLRLRLLMCVTDVSCETTRELIRQITQVASVGDGPVTVGTQMNGKPTWLRKRPRALTALEWLFASVRPHMAHQIGLLLKGGGTVGALVFFFTASRHVQFEAALDFVFGSAGRAKEFLGRVIQLSPTALFRAIVKPVTPTESPAHGGSPIPIYIYRFGEATTILSGNWPNSRFVPPQITGLIRSFFPAKSISPASLHPFARDWYSKH
jgi:hypothetical protein